MHRLGEIRPRGLENQIYRASGLALLTAAISFWNTLYIERAIDSLKRNINKTLAGGKNLVSGFLQKLAQKRQRAVEDYINTLLP